jgi:hypothetical protein
MLSVATKLGRRARRAAAQVPRFFNEPLVAYYAATSIANLDPAEYGSRAPVPSHPIPYHTTPYRPIPSHTLPSHTLPYPYPTLPYPTISSRRYGTEPIYYLVGEYSEENAADIWEHSWYIKNEQQLSGLLTDFKFRHAPVT